MDEQLEALLSALASQESGGDPTADNSRTRAYGRYQILPSNWPSWSRDALGEEVEPTPENQEKVARHRMGQYLERFGPEGALVAWYGGPGRAREWVRNPENPWFDRRHGGGQEPSVREYVQSVMGRIPSAEPPAPPSRVAAPQPADRIGQLSTALRNAHSAGDTAAAQRLAAEIVRLRGSESTSPPPETAGDPVQISDPYTSDGPNAFGGGNGRLPPMSPRERGRRSAEDIGFVGAAGQGAGSGLFGVGTPLFAAEAMIGSRLKGEPMSWDDALEYARGRKEGAWEQAPTAYGIGFGGSMVGGIRAGAGAVARLPGAVRKLITPTRAAEGASRLQRAGNTTANLIRAAGAGGTAAGVTALNQEGADAVPGATATGAAFGPIAATGIRAGGAAIGTARDLARGNGPMRLIANRLRVPVEVVEENLARWREAFPGRAPRVAEILDTRSAEEMALIGQGGVGTRAGRVFREAAADASRTRQDEVSEAIRHGGPTTTPSAETQRLAPIQREAAEELRGAPRADQPTERVGGRVQTSEAAVSGRATARYREVMDEIGDHEVPVTADMLDELMDREIQNSIPTIVRQRLNAQLESGVEAGSISLPMEMWDRLRKSLGRKAGQDDAPEIYSELRDRVTNYVSERVPEYRRLLDEYGRRSEVAAGVTAGRGALTQDTREFIDMLRTAGGGAPDRPTRPREAAMTRVGARVGARTNLANMMSRNPENMMERLANEPGLRANLQAVLQPEEWRRLQGLADRYGHQLRRVEGARAGAQGVRAAEATSDFADDAQRIQATPEGAETLAGGGRSRLYDAARESPQAATAVAEGMAEHRGLPERIATALGTEEGGRLQRVGAAATLARRNLDSMTPAGTEASQRQQAMAQEVNTIIGALVITGGRASGAMQASVGTRLMQRFQMTQRSAERAAQLLTDPAEAPKIIAYLRARGASADQIHKLYMRGAAAAGILTGSASAGGGGR